MTKTKVHPVTASIDYPNGEREIFIEEGETYFDRCAREFTATLLGNPDYTDKSEKDIVRKAIQVAMELERQLEELKNFKNGKS